MRTQFIAILVLFSTYCLAQKDEATQKVLEYYKTHSDPNLITRLQQNDIQQKLRVRKYLESLPEQPAYNINDIVDYQYGNLIIHSTTNADAATSINVDKLYNGGTLGLNIQGQGMTAGVWDQGLVLTSHVEFGSRVSQYDAPSALSNHATHVMGTVLAGGVKPHARGMAFMATGKAYDWNSDEVEMATEASGGLLVSNHSYSTTFSSNPTWQYGAYYNAAQDFDEVMHNYPYYLACVAAGNDERDWATLNSSKNGYDIITGQATIKNGIVVASVADCLNYVNQNSVAIADYSSWGPTDDGRIKPDLAANGQALESSIAAGAIDYASYSGTSMATPTVTGAVLLLQQLYKNINGSYMFAATAKGLLLHTAREAGTFVGPDYTYGWGLADAAAAASLITNASGTANAIKELTLAQGQSYTIPVSCNGAPLKVSICWTDPKGNIPGIQANDFPNPTLMNDLDVKVVQGPTTFYPWKLDVNNPSNPATKTSTNDVDNFERVDIDNASGNYSIVVSHKGTLQGGSQKYSLVISGGNILGVDDVPNLDNQVSIAPNPIKDKIYINSNNIDLSSYHISIIGMDGRILQEQDFSSTVTVENLSKGNYILLLKNNDQKIVKRFIKE